MPGDERDEIGAPTLCAHCATALDSADRHGHVDPDWTRRAAADLWRQCCNRRPA